MAKKRECRKIKQFLLSGELDIGCKTLNELLENAGRLLDASYSHEILGEVLVQLTDGTFRIMTVEALISTPTKSYLKDMMDRVEEEKAWSGKVSSED